MKMWLDNCQWKRIAQLHVWGSIYLHKSSATEKLTYPKNVTDDPLYNDNFITAAGFNGKYFGVKGFVCMFVCMFVYFGEGEVVA